MSEYTRNIRKVVRCTGQTKGGTQCARRTARTNLCFQHLEIKRHLAIKPSTIRGAGLGLFTTVPRRNKERVDDYSGKRVVNHDPDFGGEYVLQIKQNPPTFIDANESTTPGAARWANSARRVNGVTNNSHLSISGRHQTAGLVTTKKIVNVDTKHPKELLTAYGAQYWTHPARNN